MTTVELRPLTEADIEAHNAGEDGDVVRWLTDRPATYRSTRDHFERLARNAARGAGKRGFGVWLEGKLAGYIDCDPDGPELSKVGDVNISYFVHPWARRRGVAVAAVGAICQFIAAERVGTRAIIRTDPANYASVRVAERSGFTWIGQQRVPAGTSEADQSSGFVVYARALVSEHAGD